MITLVTPPDTYYSHLRSMAFLDVTEIDMDAVIHTITASDIEHVIYTGSIKDEDWVMNVSQTADAVYCNVGDNPTWLHGWLLGFRHVWHNSNLDLMQKISYNYCSEPMQFTINNLKQAKGV